MSILDDEKIQAIIMEYITTEDLFKFIGREDLLDDSSDGDEQSQSSNNDESSDDEQSQSDDECECDCYSVRGCAKKLVAFTMSLMKPR